MKSLEIVNDKIVELKDTYQHYTAVEKDKAKSSFAKFDIEQFQQIKADLQVLEILKEYVYVNPKSTDNVQIISMKDILITKQISNEKAKKVKQWLEVNENE